VHEWEDPVVPAGRLEALQLRFDEALESGELDRPVEVVVESGHGLPSGSAHLAQQAWQRLADRGVLAVIGPAITDNAMAVVNQADAQHLSTINWSGSGRSRSKYCFHYQLGALYDEGALIAAAVAATGAHDVAVIRDRSPIGDEYWESFSEAAERNGLVVRSDQKVSPVAESLTHEVELATSAGAEVFVYLGYGGILPPLWAARAAAGWTVPMFTNTAGLHWYMLPPDVRRAGTGTIYVDMYDERNTLTTKVLAAMEARFGGDDFGPITPAMYDMASLVVHGLRLATLHTREGVNEGLERVRQLPAALGGAGTVMGFGPWERTALKGPDYLLLRVMGDDATHRYDAYPPSYERLAKPAS
jgi:ABC-type branched-subunit amino acid transport system substrate-binding protein